MPRCECATSFECVEYDINSRGAPPGQQHLFGACPHRDGLGGPEYAHGGAAGASYDAGRSSVSGAVLLQVSSESRIGYNDS